ncbi:hypothetical protein ACHAXN_005805 [Cyclotella atomus]
MGPPASFLERMRGPVSSVRTLVGGHDVCGVGVCSSWAGGSNTLATVHHGSVAVAYLFRNCATISFWSLCKQYL